MSPVEIGFIALLVVGTVLIGLATLSAIRGRGETDEHLRQPKSPKARREPKRPGPSGFTPAGRFAAAIVLTLAAGSAFGEGIGGDRLIDQSEPGLLFLSLVLQLAAVYNLVVGAVQRGIIDSRY